jgi:ABC-type glycerol-3-phosphate transport system permease component
MKAAKKILPFLGFSFFGFFLFVPLVWGVRTSLAPTLDQHLLPASLTLEHYRIILHRPEFYHYAFNSLIISLASILGVLFIAMPGGYALARLHFRGRHLGGLLLILPLLPPVALLVPLVRYYQQLGLYNTLLAVILTNVVFNVPLAVWMLRNFIMSCPVEIEEAARMDGCSRHSTLWRIVLPMMAPGVVAVSLFVFINSWNNYLFSFALTSSQSLRVLPQAFLAFLGMWGTYWGGLCAAGLLVLIPPVLLFLFFQRWFVQGMFGQQLK